MIPAWWREAVIYQIYPRSWVDTDADGIGDLRGITERLDHLSWLGVDGIWLNPITPSPNDDWGYDVTDYCDVHPELGTMADMDDLLARAAELELQVLLDLVPNHTSDRHSWFLDARSSRDSEHRDWYVWADPAPDGGPPNNWVSVFGGEGAWGWDENTKQHYLHNFLSSQPDLNWWNDEVRDEFDRILDFWYRRGVAGFRIDVAHALIKDRGLRDNPPSAEADHPEIRKLGQRVVNNMNRPETHDILKRWRKLGENYDPPRVLVGETYLFDLERLGTFYGDDDELHLAFNFPFAFSRFGGSHMKAVVSETLGSLPPGAVPAWFGSNHDIGRFPTRWGNGDPATTRCALMGLLMLPGTTFLYYGDEIGMVSTKLEDNDLRDPVGKRFWPDDPGRDPGRTPMPWSAQEGAGFTSPGVTPWLPFGDLDSLNVASQREDPASTLNLCRDLISLRRTARQPRGLAYEEIPHDDLWAWRRGPWSVFVNTGDSATDLEAHGTIAIGTNRRRDGERIRGRWTIPANEGIVVA